MSNPWNLRRINLASQDMHNTPAARALALKLVSEMDLLRLKAIARLHVCGLIIDVPKPSSFVTC